MVPSLFEPFKPYYTGIYDLQELEDVRTASKQAVHEKLIAVARAKELMRQEHLVEIDRIREQLKNVSKNHI